MTESCSHALGTFFSIATGGIYFFAQGAPEMTTCLPSGYGKYEQDYYSPGICPDGYTVACSSKNAIGSLTENVQTCCPTNLQYTCYPPTGNPGQPWHSTLGCAATFPSGRSIDFTNFYGITGGATMRLNSFTSGDGGAVNAFSIQVRFQSTDFVTTSTPSTSTAGTASTSSPTTAAAAATSSTKSSDNNSSNGGLGTGALTGIGIGAAVAVFTFISGLVFFVLGQRRLHADPNRLYAYTPSQPERGANHDQWSGDLSQTAQGSLTPGYYTQQNMGNHRSPQAMQELPALIIPPREMPG